MEKLFLNKKLIYFIKNNFYISFFSALGSIASYLVQIYTGRIFGLNEYSLFSTINNLIALIIIPISILSIINVKFISQNNFDDGKRFFSNFFFFVILFISIVLISIIIFKNWIFNNIINTSNLKILPYFISFLVCTILLTVFQSLFQGQKRYIHFAIFGNSIQILKITLIISFAYFFSVTIDNIFMIITISYTLVFIFFLKNIINSLNLKNIIFNYDTFNFFKKNIGNFLITIFYLSFLTNGDIVIARILLEPNLAGYFTGNSVLAKTILIINGFFIHFLFAEGTTTESNFNLLFTIFLSSLIGMLIIIIFYFIQNELISFTYNKIYPEEYQNLVILGINYFLLSLNTMLLHNNLARKKYNIFKFIIVIVLTFFLLTYLFHDYYNIIINFLTINIITFIYLLNKNFKVMS